MKQKRTKPRPTRKKSARGPQTHDEWDDLWETLEAEEWAADCEERKNKKNGPSPEARKLLDKKP